MQGTYLPILPANLAEKFEAVEFTCLLFETAANFSAMSLDVDLFWHVYRPGITCVNLMLQFSLTVYIDKSLDQYANLPCMHAYDREH